MIRPSRTRRGPDAFLDWKVRLFFVGAALALVGIATGIEWLVGVAIGTLAAGLILSFLSKRGEAPDPGEPDDTDGVELK